MLQAEIMVRTSGQTAAWRRTYSSTFSGFKPSTMPMRCIFASLFRDHLGELGDASRLHGVPVPVDADAWIAGRQGMAVLDAHLLTRQFVELGNIFDIFAVLDGAGQADMQLHQEMRADRHVESLRRMGYL